MRVIYLKGGSSSSEPPPPVSGIDVYIAGTYSELLVQLEYNDGSPEIVNLDETNNVSNKINVPNIIPIVITILTYPPPYVYVVNTYQIQCPDLSSQDCNVIDQTEYSGFTIREKDASHNILNTFSYSISSASYSPNVNTKFLEIFINSISSQETICGICP